MTTELKSEPVEILWDGVVSAVVNKPPGLSTQAPENADSLESRLRSQFKDRSNYLAFPHRLDRPVGGVLIVALTKKAARLLSSQFEVRKVRKEYIAALSGRLPEGTTIWADHLRKVPDQARVEIVDPGVDSSRQAETGIEFVRYDQQNDRTWVKLMPVTGRMHQLRVQSASRGFPIVGDQLYGGPRSAELRDDEIALRAHSLSFFDPRNSKEVSVTASDDWTKSV